MSAIDDCFASMMAAWNERDPARMRALLDAAVTPDVHFVDPKYDLRGKTDFAAMIEAFQAEHHDVILRRTSAIDMHHDRARYSWEIEWGDGRRFTGFDAVAVNLDKQQICRIDGFFGPLQPEAVAA